MNDTPDQSRETNRVLFERLALQIDRLERMCADIRATPAIQALHEWEALWKAACDRWSHSLPERLHLAPLPLSNLRATVLVAIARREEALTGENWREFWAEIDVLQERLNQLVPDPTVLFVLKAHLEAVTRESESTKALVSARIGKITAGFSFHGWTTESTLLKGLMATAIAPKNPVGPEIKLAHEHVSRVVDQHRFRYDERIASDRALSLWKQATSDEVVENLRTSIASSGLRSMRWWLGFKYSQTPKPPRVKGSTVLVDVSASAVKTQQGYKSESQIALLTGLSAFSEWATDHCGLSPLDIEELWLWDRHDRNFETGRRFRLAEDMTVVIFANKVTLEMSVRRAEALNEYCSQPRD
ncbi:hypothetical protein C7S18_23935 (plasmid) [Ahniella affigens]|uniref:Uncharacterized protein n=1 Tax=Ahniella affigens TaxID=2021234 RepID=A0A2P1PZT2_9GAMM|nr:hypothetical protein [Ahniella affigens]AVQ00352.1 hypothetical protein C7S18_23935 [Ahniella affigens]